MVIVAMAAPQTPPPTASLQRAFPDSPFSDYGSCDSSASAAQKDLIRRVAIIGDMISKGEPTAYLTRALKSKLEILESMLSAPNTQSRLHLEDSGLFLEDDDTKVDLEDQAEDRSRLSHKEAVVDRFADSIEDHFRFFEQLLDEAKLKELAMQDCISEINDHNLKLSQRLEEVKRNNTAAIEQIHLKAKESRTLRKIRSALEKHIVEVETRNQRLQAQLAAQSTTTTPSTLQVEDPTPVDAADNATSHNAETKVGIPSTSRWGAFWDALQAATGIIDYEKLLHNED